MKNYLLIASLALLLGAGILYGSQRRRVASKNEDHTVTTTEGKNVVVKVNGKWFTADLPDGTYKLTNGGSIRVRNRKVVWDAFGAAHRLKTGHWRGFTDPTG